MKYKIALNFFLVIITIIVGIALYDQFDFQDFKFENPALAVVYFVVIILCISFMIKKSKKK